MIIVTVSTFGALSFILFICLVLLLTKPRQRGIGFNPPPTKPRPSVRPTPQNKEAKD